MKDGVIKVCVGIPNMGYTQSAAYANRLVNFMHMGKFEKEGELLKKNPRYEFYFSIVGRIFTPVARDEAAKHTIEHDCDYLYMIDDDMICPDDMFEKLVKHDVDIVAPLAFTRNVPYKPVMYHSVEGYDSVAKKDYFINNVVMNYPRNALVECDAVGFGAVLIKREVLDAVGPKAFMSTCGTGEDILFCYKAKKKGFRVFMDTATKIGHLGHPLHITEEFVDAFKQNSNYDPRKFYDYSMDSKERATYVVG